MSNPFTYAELHTKNATAAKAFYGQLFDWRMKDEPMPGGTYISVDTGDAVPGGLLDALARRRWSPSARRRGREPTAPSPDLPPSRYTDVPPERGASQRAD